MNYYYGKPKNSIKNIYRKIFYKHIIKKYLNSCDSIIDLGAGSGVFYDVAKSMNKNIIGIDLDDNNIREGIIKKDFRFIDKKYDCFFNSQFIEHVNQFELMDIISKNCNKIVITITTKPCYSFWDTPDHIRPYTPKAVKKLYENYGFKLISFYNLFPTNSFIVIGEKIEQKK
jgi:ubiquinone/menaquinone biosynthesis C-methylase UbiE